MLIRFSEMHPTAPFDRYFSVSLLRLAKSFTRYCAQTIGNHCQKGMAGVINQDFDSPNTLAAYKAKAAATNSSLVPLTRHIDG
ncbi:hypothetical protein J7T55_000105 [Diaporthe amygdali]|uniref:uncharacterized protein n=1 Tax=Phomopsis amygdali TaxID=1214568 RepID=UPI0022FDF302|nr:uncharacterized protein J7T55_000105 [Diaporthe amygdali]KAJ0100735.1 hypothetical protein J7T55_000105 [Diaporthe amygdali]